jgi:hypothetical protein
VRADIPAGVFVYLGPCYQQHPHTEPVLLRSWRTGPPTPQGDLGARLQAVLGQSEEEREQQRKERWERDREILRTFKGKQNAPNSP